MTAFLDHWANTVSVLFLCAAILGNTWSIHSITKTLRTHNHTLSIILEALRHGS